MIPFPTIVLASGGTGGHLFPAESLARALLGRGYGVALLTDSRGTDFAAGLEGIEICRLDLRRSGKSPAVRAAAAAAMVRGLFQAARAIHRLAPAAAVGFGGYPSWPTMMSAELSGIPTILHEQNTVVGRANRALAPLADVIATSFPKVEGLTGKMAARQVHVGHPVRPAFEALREIEYRPPQPGEPLRLLVTGGSQGASVFAGVVPDALARLPEDLRRRMQVAQQCRPEDLARVAEQYRNAGIAAETAPFFSNLAERLKDTHLAIGRSGASTTIENAIAGRPSIFVPLPGAISDEQTSNAWAMETAGAAILIKQADFTPEYLATRLEALLGDPERLSHMARAARDAGKPRAAESLADLVTDLIEGRRSKLEGKAA